jgi:nitrogen fixation protein NifU and related proteins
MYNKKVYQYFRKAKNVGKIRKHDGLGKVGNVICGDVMHLYMKVGKNKKGQEILKDIKFQTFGCVAAIATSNMICEIAKGKTLEQGLKVNKQSIIDELGGLPPVKVHCSVLAADALVEAIYNFYSRNKREISPELEKRHIRIAKEKDIIEDKYHDWTEGQDAELSK